MFMQKPRLVGNVTRFTKIVSDVAAKRRKKLNFEIANRIKNKVIRVSLWELFKRIFENQHGTHLYHH